MHLIKHSVHAQTYVYMSCVHTVHLHVFPANNMCIISCRTEREGCCRHFPSRRSRRPSGCSWADTRRYLTCSVYTHYYTHTHIPWSIVTGTWWYSRYWEKEEHRCCMVTHFHSITGLISWWYMLSVTTAWQHHMDTKTSHWALSLKALCAQNLF